MSNAVIMISATRIGLQTMQQYSSKTRAQEYSVPGGELVPLYQLALISNRQRPGSSCEQRDAPINLPRHDHDSAT